MTSRIQEYINHVKKSFINAEKEQSKLIPDILNLEGYSGRRTRHFYNNIASLNDARYLEIGTWKGSTISAAMHGNADTRFVCIDNWSELGGPRAEFINIFNKYKGTSDANFVETNCFTFDVKSLPITNYNIYMYDGSHEEISHYKALTHYTDVMEDVFIYVCDDWNWKCVRDGTMKAIHDLGLHIEYEYNIRTSTNDQHSIFGSDEQLKWHNGIYVAVLRKNSA